MQSHRRSDELAYERYLIQRLAQCAKGEFNRDARWISVRQDGAHGGGKGLCCCHPELTGSTYAYPTRRFSAPFAPRPVDLIRQVIVDEWGANHLMDVGACSLTGCNCVLVVFHRYMSSEEAQAMAELGVRW